MCYPFGREYTRAFRTYLQTAIRLARAGFPVLRFDYYGTGDSSGDEVPGQLSAWLAGIASAVEELKARSGVSRVWLIGLRIGGTLAMMASSRREDITGAIAWNPAIRGKDFIDDLMAQGGLPPASRNGDRPPAGATELAGFAYPNELLDELRQVDLGRAGAAFPKRLLLLESEGAYALKPLTEAASGGALNLEHQVAASRRIWLESEGALVPGEIVNAIVSWLSRETV